jgi:predicted HTH domain antitoxin
MWEFLMIELYREGKMSLGTLSSKLKLSVSETIDLLAEFGVESPVDYEDYLKGFDVFKVK